VLAAGDLGIVERRLGDQPSQGEGLSQAPSGTSFARWVNCPATFL
jgi:hypothetical protein